MKKSFRLLSLLITAAMLISAMGIPAFADDEAVFTELFKMNFDDLGYVAGDTYRSTGTLYYPTWPNSFISIGGYDSYIELSDINGDGNLWGKGVNNSSNSNVTYVVLPDIAKTKAAETVALRKQDTVLTFDFMMSSDMYLKVWTYGTHPDYTENFTEGSNVLATTLMEIKEGNNNIVNYSYTPGSVANPTSYSNTTLFQRDTVHSAKFVFKAPEYTDGSLTGGGTYDVYFDGILIAKGMSLSGPGYLYKLYIQFFAKNTANGISYIDNIAYYSLAEGDSDSQTTYTVTGEGSVKPVNAVTKAGDTQSFVITPDEGYEISEISYNGNVVKGYDRSGFTYVTPAITAEGGELSVTFAPERTFGKAFGIDFNGYTAGATLLDNIVTGANTNINLGLSSNIFAAKSALYSHQEEGENKSIKIYTPKGASSNDLTAAAMYTFINANDYAETVKREFAVAFRLKLSEGQYFRYLFRNNGATSSKTVLETANNTLNIYGCTADENGAITHTTLNTGYTVADGEYHDYKLVFSPWDETFEVYVDNKLLGENIALAGYDWIYYALLQIRGNTAEDTYAYIDDYSCYRLTENDVDAQLNVTSENGSVTADNIVTAEDEAVNVTVTPDYGFVVSSVTLNGEVINPVEENGSVYSFNMPSEGAELKVDYTEVRHFKEIVRIDAENYEADQIIADSLNDDTVGNQTNIDFVKVDNSVVANAWITDAKATAVSDENGNKAVHFYMPQGTADAKSNVTMYGLLENNDKTLYKETTSDYFALSFRLNIEEGQEGRFLLRSAVKDTGGKSLFTLGGNKITFYDYYYNEEGKYVYNGVKCALNVNDGEDHFYKFVVNPKAETYNAYIDNILVVENGGIPDMTQVYYATLQMYGSIEKALNVYLDDYTVYEMTAEDAAAQLSVTMTGSGKAVADKDITKAGDKINVTVTPAEGSVITDLEYNGKLIPAFASDLVYEKVADAGDKIRVNFTALNENEPATVTTDYAVKDGNKIYLFNKLMANGCEVAEYGMLLSKTNKAPVIGGADVKTIVYDLDRTVNGNAAGKFGYYGYMLHNATGEENIIFTVRPYAKVGENVYYGAAKTIDTATLGVIGE